ncbi:MAG: hypothetical protein AAF752_01900, partial [Bacteroidota bacterium]
MYWRLYILLGGLVLGLAAPAQAAQDESLPMLVADEAALVLVEEGRAHMLALRFEAAEASFERLIEEGSAPAGRFHLAALQFYEAMIRQDEASFEDFFDATEALKELLDSVEDSGPWPAWFRAENELQRAFIQARRRSYAKAAMSGRSAYGLYESIVEEHPAFAEAYKGRGLLRIMIGSVPGSFRWVLNTFGYGGTVEEGMDDLRKAARESRFGAVEAE